MSRDIYISGIGRDNKGVLDTSITKASAESFESGHKMIPIDSSYSWVANSSSSSSPKEEARLSVELESDCHNDFPSFLEAPEAVHELQKSVKDRRYAAKDASPSWQAQDNEENLIENASQDTQRLQLENSRSNDAVAYCVEMLRHDPNLQDVVVSLASDPAVWNAFQRNEKMQELMRTRKLNQSQLQVDNHIEANFLQHPELRGHPFLAALSSIKNLVWDSVSLSINFVNNAFSFIDRKIFGETTSDPLDKPYKACIVLTMLVLALVVLKKEPNK